MVCVEAGHGTEAMYALWLSFGFEPSCKQSALLRQEEGVSARQEKIMAKEEDGNRP